MSLQGLNLYMLRRRCPANRKGFSAIELLIVLGIAISLTATAAPALMTALRRSSVSRSADMIMTVAEKAQALSRQGVTTGKRYGVAIVSDPTFLPSTNNDLNRNGTFAILIYGSLLTDVAGYDVNEPASVSNPPLMVKRINDNAAVFTAASRLGGKTSYSLLSSGGTVGWFYSNGLPQGGLQTLAGYVVDASGTPIEIGTEVAGSGGVLVNTWPSDWLGTPPAVYRSQPAQFGVCTPSGDYGMNIVIFNCGVCYAHEVPRNKP